MTKKLPNRRQKKYINRQIQGRIAAIVVLNGLMYIFLLSVLIFAPLAYRIYSENITPELQQAADAFLALHEHFWPAIFILLSVIGLHSIRISHRMAGPVYRFKETFKEMQRGDLSTHITLRSGDFFVDLMEEFNKTTISLREGFKGLKEQDEHLQSALIGLNQQLDDENVSIEALKRLTRNAQESELKLKRLLEGFQLEKKDD
ncbi:MAG: hypothetical protein ACE5GK_02200 [Nitrospiria bacterium]